MHINFLSKSFIIILLLLFVFSCGASQKVINNSTTNNKIETKKHPALAFHWPYDLEEPSHTIELDEKLNEISGLSLHTNPNFLCGVQDELGLIFLIEKKTGKIKQEIPFWKEGDYEGIEAVGDDVFVVKSKGTIYQIKYPGTEAQEVVKHKFFLSKENDVEGLCYDKKNNALLLACKSSPNHDEHTKFNKMIYSFNLETQQMDTLASCFVSLNEIQDYLDVIPKSKEEMEKNLEDFGSKDMKDLTFYPSAIAIHPITGNYYIVSSRGKRIAVLRPDGKILHLEKLNKKIHQQPEGLVFEADGTLYISNEAKKGIANIHRFNYQKKGSTKSSKR